MVKPGLTGTHDLSNSSSSVRRASAITQDLIAGRVVSPAAISAAREAFIESLWNGPSATEGAARDGLFVLYAKAADAADKAELIGELFAVGLRGQSILEEIARRDASTKLTPAELGAFQGSAGLPLDERLMLVLAKLATEAAVERGQGGSQLPERQNPSPREPAIMPNPEPRLKEGETPDPEGGPPDLDPEMLKDDNVPPETRQAMALQLGPAAVPVLKALLLNQNPALREFAVSTLILLGRTGQTRSVTQAMRQLETQPETRRMAELVRQSIEPGQHHDPRARGRARDAGIQDGWLRRAFASCDTPSILKASAGREVLAISMGVRMLHEMRARRG